MRGRGPFWEEVSIWGAGRGWARLSRTLGRRTVFGMEEALRLVGHPQAAAPPGASGSRTTPLPPCLDLADLLGPWTRVRLGG